MSWEGRGRGDEQGREGKTVGRGGKSMREREGEGEGATKRRNRKEWRKSPRGGRKWLRSHKHRDKMR